jgi:diguanylate cyclase (GGDEF)-like protein
MEQQVEERTHELEQRTEELLTLSTLGEFLQRCHTTAEAFAVIARFAHRLFPEDAGVMSARRSLRPDLEPVISWGGLTADHAVTDPEMCWALTCGKVHLAENPDTDLFCAHTQQEPIGPHLCIPFFVQHEVCGVLHLRLAPPAEDQPGTEWTRLCAAKQRLGTALAEQVSLALSNILLREQLHQQAVRDPLTGLYNRRMLDEALNREIRRAGRAGRTIGIILFDVDHFKRFNDTYGHPAGDTLLAALGDLLRMLFRAEDILCRYGGEEFLIILPEASLPDALARAEDLRREASRMQVRHQNQDLPTVTISLGVAAFPVHGTSGHALVQRADAALYQAKMDGRNQVVVSPTGLLFTEEQG